MLAVLAILMAGAAVAIAASRNDPGSAAAQSGSGPGQRAFAAAAADRSHAASWIVQRVSRSAIVACDPAECAALRADGLPAANLLLLNSATPDPLGADVVVATSVVRGQFGSRLAGVYAPAVIARFGSGTARIEIRVVATAGAAAYQAALAEDEQARKKAAAQLLGNSRIHVSAAARAELAAGRVDSRLLLVLPALAAVHPVSVLAFGDAGPGADPGMPLCSAELAASFSPARSPARMTDASYQQWLLAYLRSQRPPFNSQVTTAKAPGVTVVDVQFASPSPLGLLTGSR